MMKDHKNWRIINLILILLVLLFTILLPIKVWVDSRLLVSPLLPKYVPIYMNASYINLMTFAIGGLIPTLFLRLRKVYFYSTLCLIIFILVGYILKDSLLIYEHFYKLL